MSLEKIQMSAEGGGVRRADKERPILQISPPPSSLPLTPSPLRQKSQGHGPASSQPILWPVYTL